MKQEMVALIWRRWQACIVLKLLESDLICLFYLITTAGRPLFHVDVVSGIVPRDIVLLRRESRAVPLRAC